MSVFFKTFTLTLSYLQGEFLGFTKELIYYSQVLNCINDFTVYVA